MSKKIFIFSVVIIVALFLQSVSFGFELVEDIILDLEENLEEGSVIGLGILFPERAYKGMDSDVYVVPIIDLEYKSFFINQSSFGFYLFNGDMMKVSIAGAARLAGYKADDSSDLNGMQDRDGSFDGGLRLQLKGKSITFTVTGLTDILDEYKGQEINATLSAKLLKGFLRPRIGIRWFSDDLVDYYYGVRSSEVATGRPIYQPGDTLNYLVGLTIGLPIDQRWALVGDIQYEVLGEDIEDSPIVDEEALFRFTAGVVYRF